MSKTVRIVEMRMNSEFSARCFPGQILQDPSVSVQRCSTFLRLSPSGKPERPQHGIYGSVLCTSLRLEESFRNKGGWVVWASLLEGDRPGTRA